MKLMVFNEKGGVGKSTLAVSLAVKLRLPFIDLDAQKTGTRWLERRDSFEVGSVDSPSWVADCRPTIELRDVRPLLLTADLVIVPLRASFPDLVTLDGTIEFLLRNNPKIAFCGADVDTRTSDLANLKEGLQSYSQPLLGFLSHRASYRRAGINGQTAAEIDKVAAAELDEVIKKIKEFLK